MSVRVLYFARSRELTGRGAQEVTLEAINQHAATSSTSNSSSSATPVAPASASASATAAAAPSASVRGLLAFLLHAHPQLSSLLPTSLLALNQEFIGADSDAPLRAGDELAFIQPISGG